MAPLLKSIVQYAWVHFQTLFCPLAPNISFKTGLLATNSILFSLSESLFSPFLKDIFPEYGILGQQVYFFLSKIPCQRSQISKVTIKKKQKKQRYHAKASN